MDDSFGIEWVLSVFYVQNTYSWEEIRQKILIIAKKFGCFSSALKKIMKLEETFKFSATQGCSSFFRGVNNPSLKGLAKVKVGRRKNIPKFCIVRKQVSN